MDRRCQCGMHIHRYGRIYPAGELITRATGEPLNPAYFARYLREKYAAVYGISA